MAQPQDTVSIQPDTVTLSGYKIWNVDDILRNPAQELPRKLWSVTKAAENFKWVAEDLPNLSVSQTRTSLLRLLKYYLLGMMHAYERCTPMRDTPMRWPCEKHVYERRAYEKHAYEMAYGRGTHMRDARL
jgi:hypothetical protein